MLDPSIIPLLYLCSIAGFVMVAGGIFLLYKEKIYIDKDTKEVTSIETPIGKFRTNAPALALFALGFIPLVIPIYLVKENARTLQIDGQLDGDSFPVSVYAVTGYDMLQNKRRYTLTVPANTGPGTTYKVIYYSNSQNMFIEETVDSSLAADGVISLPEKRISAAATPTVFIQPQLEDIPMEFR
jgi:hypothetical protein